MSTDLIDISMFIIFASKNITIARVDKGKAVLTVSDPSGHITTRQESVIVVGAVQQKPISKILNIKVRNTETQTQTQPMSKTYPQSVFSTAILSVLTARISKLLERSKS